MLDAKAHATRCSSSRCDRSSDCARDRPSQCACRCEASASSHASTSGERENQSARTTRPVLGILILSLHAPARLLTIIAASLRRHPKRITASLAVLLLGTGVTAFGVAPMAPDASQLPVRQVLESVEPLAIAPQTDALADFRFSLFRTDTTRSSDTMDTVLRRLNIDDAAAALAR